MKWILLFSLTTLSAKIFAQSPRTISDELVSELVCSKAITEAQVLKSIDPSKAFALSKVIPVKNWGFNHNNLYELGACWSLSHFARQVFYLGRDSQSLSTSQKIKILNSARGFSPRENAFGVRFERDLNLSLIPQSASDLALLYKENIEQKLPSGRKILRNLKTDLEAYQSFRFHQPENANLVAGERERPAAENLTTLKTLRQNLPANKLTLVVLRAARNAQHVLVALRIDVLPNGDSEILVYDSNSPFKNQVIRFDPVQKQFFAPEINRLFGAPQPQAPVGLFVVDEADRERQLKFLTRHYQKLCDIEASLN